MEPAATILRAVAPTDLVAFDRDARRTALSLAAKLQLPVSLHLNVTPGALADVAQLVRDLSDGARTNGLKPGSLALEISESDVLRDVREFSRAVGALRAAGVRLAIDDFGAEWAGLNLLADYQPDLIKLDMALVRNIHTAGPKQAIVRGIMVTCEDLGIGVIAEGVETEREYRWLREQHVSLFQGYLFARPGFESLPLAHLPEARNLPPAPPVPVRVSPSSTDRS